MAVFISVMWGRSSKNRVLVFFLIQQLLVYSLPLFACEESAAESDPKAQNFSSPYNSFNEDNWLDDLWGRSSRDKLYLGMWAHHFEKNEGQENNNRLIGLTYHGYYGGTFINTHGHRVWSGGWQRTLVQQEGGDFSVEAGYRLGIMHGYRRYLTIGNSRIFPLLQAVVDIDYQQVGVQLSWAGIVATAGLLWRF